MASGSKEKKTFHAAAFSVFLIVSTLIFLFFFTSSAKKGMPLICWSCLIILM